MTEDTNEEAVKEEAVKLVYMPEDLILKAPTFKELEVGESGEARLGSLVLDKNGAIYIDEYNEILQPWENDYHNTTSVSVIRLEEGYHIDLSNNSHTKYKFPKNDFDDIAAYYKPVVSISR